MSASAAGGCALNILHYLQNVRLRDGGVVRAVLDLCSLLPTAGHEVTLMCCGEAEVPERWSDADGNVPRVLTLPPPGAGGLLSKSVLVQAGRALEGADVVHLHGMWELSNHQIAWECRRIHKPYVFSPHGMLDDWSMSLRPLKKKVVLSVAARRTLEKAACVHFAAKGEMQQSTKRFTGRACVAPLVFDPSPFRQLPGPSLARERWPQLAGGRPVLLFLSRIVENKGPDIVIGAAARLKDQKPLVVIAGGGEPAYVASLGQMAESRGVESLFTGHVDGELKLSLIQAATVFILPTIHENFGFATLEALACGTPAVTTPGNLLREELEGSGGAVIADRAETAVATAVSRIVSQTEVRESMSAMGRRWALERFEPARMIAAYESLYRGQGTGH